MTGYDWTVKHGGHEVGDVSMSWGNRQECHTCRKTLCVTGYEDDVIWQEGESIADLNYVLRGRPHFENPGPKPEFTHPNMDTRYWDTKKKED